MGRTTTVVLGKGTLAIRVADWFRRQPAYDLLGVVPVVPEPSWTDSLSAWATDAGVPCVGSGDYRDLDLPDEDIGLAFSVFYDRVIHEAFIQRCRRILNLHNSPLPRYRGVSPINWALKNGETKHGVTIHEIVAEIDAGPIVAQLEYSIYPETDEVEDVYRRALAYGWTLFEQTMPNIDMIVARPQDEALATYYSAADSGRLGDRRGFTRTAATSAPSVKKSSR